MAASRPAEANKGSRPPKTKDDLGHFSPEHERQIREAVKAGEAADKEFRAVIRQAREEGESWPSIAASIGLSAREAKRRYGFNSQQKP